MGHKHAELMKLYAEDAAETDKPWERWEVKVHDSDFWVHLDSPFVFFPNHQYRRRPQTIIINGLEVAKPVSECDPDRGHYISVQLVVGYALKRSTQLDHLTAENAMAHFEALVKASRGE